MHWQKGKQAFQILFPKSIFCHKMKSSLKFQNTFFVNLVGNMKNSKDRYEHCEKYFVSETNSPL